MKKTEEIKIAEKEITIMQQQREKLHFIRLTTLHLNS